MSASLERTNELLEGILEGLQLLLHNTSDAAQKYTDSDRIHALLRAIVADTPEEPEPEAEGECEHFAQWGDEGATGCAALSPEDEPQHIACVISKWRHSKGPLAQRQDCPIRALSADRDKLKESLRNQTEQTLKW